MTSRFDNLSTEQLAERHRANLDDYLATKIALEDRLRAECRIEIGQVYRIADDDRPFAGRLLLVEGIVPNVIGPTTALWHRGETCIVRASGRLNGKSAAGDGWTIKRQQVRVDRLTLEPGR